MVCSDQEGVRVVREDVLDLVLDLVEVTEVEEDVLDQVMVQVLVLNVTVTVTVTVTVVGKDAPVQVWVMVVERGEVSREMGMVMEEGGQGVVCQVLGVLVQVGMVAQVLGQALVHQTFDQTLCPVQVHHWMELCGHLCICDQILSPLSPVLCRAVHLHRGQ